MEDTIRWRCSSSTEVRSRLSSLREHSISIYRNTDRQPSACEDCLQNTVLCPSSSSLMCVCVPGAAWEQTEDGGNKKHELIVSVFFSHALESAHFVSALAEGVKQAAEEHDGDYDKLKLNLEVRQRGG